MFVYAYNNKFIVPRIFVGIEQNTDNTNDRHESTALLYFVKIANED